MSVYVVVVAAVVVNVFQFTLSSDLSSVYSVIAGAPGMTVAAVHDSEIEAVFVALQAAPAVAVKFGVLGVKPSNVVPGADQPSVGPLPHALVATTLNS